MDLPASYYGELDQRNPVLSAFRRDINSFITLMKQEASSTNQHNSTYAKGIKILVEIWKKFKHRLPLKIYQEHMLQIADFLFGIKLYQLALWHGYSLHLSQYSSVIITDITDVDHFMACFFPEGLDTDQNIFAMKVRAMQGCALCIFELERQHRFLSQKGLCKLLRVLNFMRTMMQAFQQHEHLYQQIYNGSLHIYNICRYLMAVKCSAQALEYLLWASISLELSITLMTAKYLPMIVTLYCAVCQCYYDSQAEVKAEEFARRALGKISELAKLGEHGEVSATRETQRAYKDASIKLGAMIFKRAAFETRKRPKTLSRSKVKSTMKDIPNVPWPRTPTERTLIGLFECSPAQFLGILEALWDSNARPLQMRMPEDPELQEVYLELLSAGISLLSGVTGEPRCDDHPCLSPLVLTSASTLVDLAISGENKIPIASAVKFIKLLFQYKQLDAFTELATEMLQVLSGVDGQSFRRAEQELALLHSFNILLSTQRSPPKEDIISKDRHKASFSMSDNLTDLVHTLHKSVCDSPPEVQPDKDMVLDIVLFLWGKMKPVIQRDPLQNPQLTHYQQKADNHDKWLWCLYVLCEVAFACDLADVDCIMMAEMSHTLSILLENAAECFLQTPTSACERDHDDVKLKAFSLLESSSTELLQKVCKVVKRGLESLARGAATLLPQDCSAFTDFAFMQKFIPFQPSAFSTTSKASSKDTNADDKINMKKGEVETHTGTDFKGCRQTEATRMYLLTKDLHLELDIILHRASLKLLQLNAVVESELLERIKKNKVSKALFLVQKALLVYNNTDQTDISKAKSLLEDATTLIEKAGMEERKVYMSSTPKTPSEDKCKGIKEEGQNPPPPPILLSRNDHSMSFAPAPYNLEGQVCWYQLCGRVAEGINRKVRLGDCSLPGTGNMVPAVSSECVLRVEGLEPNQKYVFAVAAYNSQGKLLGNTIGGTTLPVLASMPVPLLSAWAHLAKVAFQTEQYAIAKRACGELWSHCTYPNCESSSKEDRLAITGLHKDILQYSSPHLCQLLLTSIFIETEINIQEGSLYCDSFSANGPFIWEQEARLAECERMLVAMDLAMCLNDAAAALQAAVSCYGLLAPMMFHQITCDSVVQVLKKCLMVLEENSGLLKQKWTENTPESFMHMIACITYYLAKALRVLRKHEMAAAVMDCGCRLLQEVYQAQLQIRKLTNQSEGRKMAATAKTQMKTSLQLKALEMKNKKRTASEALHTPDPDISAETSQPLIGSEDPNLLYDLISSSTLKDAYMEVMKLRRKVYFTEFAALLLQRTMEEGHLDLVLEWGKSLFQILSRRDEVMVLSTKCLEEHSQIKQGGVIQNETAQSKNASSHDDTRKKLKQKLPQNMLLKRRTRREVLAVENLLALISSVVQRQKKRLQLRHICSEERVWRAQLNYCMAQAHLAKFYQCLDRQHRGALEQRYSQFHPLCFSLAYSGVLLWRKNSQQQQLQSSKNEAVLHMASSGCSDRVMTADKDGEKNEVDGSVTEDTCKEGEGSSHTMEQQMEAQMCTSATLLDSLNKAAIHLQRAMVLAHRGNHWTTLQCVCQSMWDQGCRITALVQRAAQLETPSLITSDQLHTILTPLLVLATDLIMDMLNKLGLWGLYDSDLTEDALESSLHFSASLDDSTQVDLRWVRTLVLYTLERLHDSGKWESLAHFALLFNSYTRDRYTFTVTPLLVHAQRKLLERIDSFGGPAVPQPHHINTQKATGKEVTNKSYAGCQLLSGRTHNAVLKRHIHKNAAPTNLTPQEAADLKVAEIQHSMSLVRVPLDVEDTLSCYRQALEKKPYCLHIFQHSRSLLELLLANTQPCSMIQMPHCLSRGLSHSASLVNFSPVVMLTPNIQPCDLTQEDYSTPNAIYGLPISRDHLPTVTAAYSTCIKYLQANGHNSLRVLALHELGNLQFYSGNTRAAHSCWSKAVDCALQSSGALEKWDGLSFGGGSVQQTLRQTGIWGCLQAAVVTAKIAQYSLTSDISRRTKYCLLSAHLFKSLLYCSMAHPQADLQYASYSIGDQLFPGVDLFSEPHRLHLGTTVTSLNFICHWLFTTGYCITLLPTLALYLHFVGTVCRDVQRTVEGKILKIRVLTELCLFTEAVKEAVQLTRGTGVLLPHGQSIASTCVQPTKTFCSNKSLLDNAEALEELVNCDFTPEVCTLYGAALCVRFNLARVQLVVALTNAASSFPVSDSLEGEVCGRITSRLVDPKDDEQDSLDTEDCCPMTEERKVLTLNAKTQKLTPERIKFLLLEGASSLLNTVSQQLESHSLCKMETLEMTIEFNLLKGNVYMQQGHTALCFEMAVSSLKLLQTSPAIVRGSQTNAKDFSESDPQNGDSPRVVEASERAGVYLWLRCRLALVHSLVAHNPGTTELLPGKNINEEAARVLQEGLDECALWGDLDIQALLMVEGARLEARRGKTDNSIAMLQKAVSLLSGRTCTPPKSVITLAQATLLLSDLRGVQSVTPLQLMQKLLRKQLCDFGQSVQLVDGKMCFPPPGPSNIYLLHLNILNQTTLQIGNILGHGKMGTSVSDIQPSQSTSRQSVHQTEKDSQAVSSPNNPTTSSPK
ncbi:cilia- and flagella-associated protein 54 isoform X2 [Archocentrus centrarchus]|uniref:cilia- and flagella-associated protein 54 isoform X2 n=1 Tax=Archocentrus centrarchus TaxID=63155 RepID=UPI0011EA106D|nr:cilia- and flagella-associated protein 54 isoform X2 [Archocentrus centrarchus]